MKRYEVKAEMRVLRTICEGDDEAKGKILGILDPTYFGYGVAREIYQRVLSLLTNDKPKIGRAHV